MTGFEAMIYPMLASVDKKGCVICIGEKLHRVHRLMRRLVFHLRGYHILTSYNGIVPQHDSIYSKRASDRPHTVRILLSIKSKSKTVLENMYKNTINSTPQEYYQSIIHPSTLSYKPASLFSSYTLFYLLLIKCVSQFHSSLSSLQLL